MDTQELAERVGQLADSADNYLAWVTAPAPLDIRYGAMVDGLKTLSASLKELHEELAGGNPWAEVGP